MKWSDLDLSSQECKTRQFPAIDIMKLLCAILVVTIHTSPLVSVNTYLNYGLVYYVARLAVPFFFVASGYFCFRKTQLANFDIKKPIAYAKRIFILYLAWSAIYLPQVGYSIYKHEKGLIWGILSSVRTFLFVGYHHLWYLLATAIAVTIISVALYKKIKLSGLLTVGFILYVVGLLGQSYFELLRPLEGTILWTTFKLYAKVFTTTRNAFFEGILFVGIGAMFAHRKVDIKKNVAICGFAISMILLLIEAFCVKYLGVLRGGDLYLFLLPATFFLFYCTSHIEVKESVFARKARTYSSLIYYTHDLINVSIVSVIVKLVEKITGTAEYEMHSLLRFGIVMVGAVVASYMIIWLQRFKCFKWLRKLY